MWEKIAVEAVMLIIAIVASFVAGSISASRRILVLQIMRTIEKVFAGEPNDVLEEEATRLWRLLKGWVSEKAEEKFKSIVRVEAEKMKPLTEIMRKIRGR